MLIGVISDTHGLLRPGVFDVFREVDCILHAGDIGSQDILIELEALAPVHAVLGNTDDFPLVGRLPETRSIQLAGVRAFMTHIGGQPEKLRERYPEIAHMDLVIFGHSHLPLQLEDKGTVFFNPGSAGPRRFSNPITVGRITIQDTRLQSEIIHLER